MSIRRIFSIALAMIALSAASAGAVGIEAALGVWDQSPKGNFAFKGTGLDLESELGLGSKTRIMGRVKVELPMFLPNIYLMATPMEFKGTGSKGTTFQFGDKTFNANVPFNSKLQLDHYDIALFWTVPFLKTVTMDKLNVELGLDARIIDLKAEINQQFIGVESTSKTVPVPMAYVGVQVKPVKWFAAEAEGRGITYGHNRYYDLIGRGKLIFLDHFFAAGGYRYEKIKLDVSDVKADTSFSGPFGEVGVQF